MAGSFASNFLIEIVARKDEHYIYIVPTSIECILLFLVAIFGKGWVLSSPNTIACTLLFAMGLQNSLVTTISNSSVRTTHLTGLFTDLGIDLSQLFFYKTKERRCQLMSSIRLRMTIISFFFIGGIVGGIFYAALGLKVLLIAFFTLVFGLIYDSIKFKLILLKRKYHN